MLELTSIPEEWFRDMSEEERERITQEENARLDRMLSEEGFDPFDDPFAEAEAQLS